MKAGSTYTRIAAIVASATAVSLYALAPPVATAADTHIHQGKLGHFVEATPSKSTGTRADVQRELAESRSAGRYATGELSTADLLAAAVSPGDAGAQPALPSSLAQTRALPEIYGVGI